ncbi:hypothetical protein CP533_2060 [Ophiocordyceps camponoti-saundersi (nom. inval.)]|nr:hypothetical protein CP533_2060 [Ophiocordyceps camponoti-saundersi (nom. inval.)]
MALTSEQVALVKSTAPLLAQHGKAITTTFYQRMLSARPELNNIFSLRHQHEGAQQAALASAVVAYAAHIDNLQRLAGAIDRIAQRHASLMVQPEQYAVIGEFLVAAFAEVLGDEVLTPAIADAWVAAYNQLADIFIQRERELYDEMGDWRGWRAFCVVHKEIEAEDIVSLYLRPVDGRLPLPRFRPGQYVSARISIPELDGLFQSRQFSLSTAPREGMDLYRVSVKREDNTTTAVAGLVSNRLHDDFDEGDELELSAPRGEFFWDEKSGVSAVVLLSIGVGATPLMSILQSVVDDNGGSTNRAVSWVHGARHSDAVCFGDDIRAIAVRHANVRPLIFVKTVHDGDEPGRDYDIEGRLSLDRAAGEGALHLDDDATNYYLCGPAEWMVQTRAWLGEKGVESKRVHMELFSVGEHESVAIALSYSFRLVRLRFWPGRRRGEDPTDDDEDDEDDGPVVINGSPNTERCSRQMARGETVPRRPSAGAASRTLSSGSFHAGAPILTLADFRRASSYRYQTFPAMTPPAEAHASDDDGDASGSSTDSSSAGGSPPPHEQTPLPVRQLLLLAFLSLAEQTALNSISPYLPRMVASMPGIPPGQIGLYVGTLASAFALAQLSTNFLWGYASDLVGRKPVLLAGTASLAGCFALFGLCEHYWHIVVVHVAMGLLNGNAACVPTVLGEITDRSNQSKAFTYLPVIYSLGGITGPALGGLLVGRVSSSHPYLAPNVCAAVLLALSVVVVALWFQETLEDDDLGPWKPQVLHRLSSWLRFKTSSRAGASSWSSRWPHAQTTNQRRPLLSPDSSPSSSSAADEDDVNSPSPCNQAALFSKASTPANGPTWRDLLNHTTLLLLTTYLVFQLSNISFNSLFPIFAAAPAPTGRELAPDNIGVSLSFAGLATILFQAFLYQPLKANTGSLGAYRLSLLGIAVSMVLMPWVGYLDDEPLLGIGTGRLWLYTQLGFVLVLKNICAVGGLSSVMLLITNSAPSHASLGTLNGVAQTLSALGRSFGPFVSGGLFSLSIDVRPKGEALAWSVFGGLALVGWIGSLFICGDGLESEDWDSEDKPGDDSGHV